MELKQHPLSAAFPAMSADDFQALKDDIEVNGQREPVIVFEGMVLDGWHRYQACEQLGLKVQKFSFDQGEDPVAFVLSHNLHRRHLTASQRAAAVVACSSWKPSHREAKNNGKSESNQGLRKVEAASTLLTNATMAKAAGTTVRTITDAKTAVKAGLGDAVKDGAMTAEQAAALARGKPVKKEPKPAAAPADAAPSDDEIAASQKAIDDELAELRSIALADDKLDAALTAVKRLTAQNRVLTERNNGLMNEKAELVKRIKSLQRKLEAQGAVA